MREESVRKRGWVKNATIIFLAALVVFLLFSNTIFNLGLPEVAVQQSGSGSITARIRGAGTVSAIERYEVMTTQTWEVREVRVRPGAEVQPGDILIVMAGEVSEELDVAREALHSMEVELERMLIDTSDNMEIVQLQRAAQEARDELSDAERARDAIFHNSYALAAVQGTVNSANATLSALQVDEVRIQADINRVQNQIQPEIDRLESNASDIQHEIDVLLSPFHQDNATALENAQGRLESIREQISTVRQALVEPNGRMTTLRAQITATELVLENARSDLTELQGSQSDWDAANNAVTLAQRNLTRANQALSDAVTQANRDDPNHLIDIREKERDIELKRDEIEDLERDGTGSELTSPVYGTIASVNITPGNQAQTETPLIIIDVIDRGFSLSIPVTVEQSMRVTIGDNADVDRGFFGWGDDLSATLVGIRNDPENPATGRRLEFMLHGNIESGEQLNVTLNQRSENFEIVVPNAALRSDTNGDFVLIITRRQTPAPLADRLIATRVDVNILARDDTHVAVSGGLSVWGESVITTSTAPVEPGMQIRLAANP